MEALSRHFQTGSPWEFLYANDLDITVETQGKLFGKFRVGISNLEAKGLHVIVGKTKIIASVHNDPEPVEASKFLCDVCIKGAGSNSVKRYDFRAHKRLSSIKLPPKCNPDFKCKKCRDEV